MTQLRVFLFGPPRVEMAGREIDITPRKALALLVYLAVTGQPHTRDALATLFWPESDQTSSRAALRRTLYRLQQALPQPILKAGAETIQVDPAAQLWTDVSAFQTALHAGLPSPTLVDHLAPAAYAHLEEAAALQTDDFMAGFTLEDAPAFDEWQFFQREGLRGELGRVLHQLQHTAIGRGDWPAAIAAARRRLALDALEESVQRDLMRVYAWAGQQAAALRQYQECVRLLETELGVEPEAETVALYEAIRGRRVPPPPIVAAAGEPAAMPAGDAAQPAPVADTLSPPLSQRAIPTPPTPFVGRNQEVAGVMQTLYHPECHILTLVGMGGIGKTRLAIQVAHELSQADPPIFRDGVVFVALGTVTDSDGIVTAIVDATGLRFSGSVAWRARLLEALATRQLLLVLDNFEHLLEGVELLDEIAAQAPHVKLLVTSRVALPSAGAWFYPVGGMSFPAQPVDDEPERFEAVELFVQCARRARPDFRLDQNQEAVATICRLVTGMPLAVELAAAWLRGLPAAAVAAELHRGLDILSSRFNGLPARHRSMRAVIEQSWALLDAEERAVLPQLAVMRGGFRLPAAVAVTGAGLPVITSLVEKSLLVMDGERYSMHELLRQFALEHLPESAQDADAVYARFSTYYLDFLAERTAAIIGPTQRTVLGEIDAEADNVAAAWQWAVAHANLDALNRALECYNQYLWLQSRTHSGLHVFDETLRQLAESPAATNHPVYTELRPHLLRIVGIYHYAIGQFDQATADLEVALDATTDQKTAGEILTDLATIAIWQGRRAATDRYCHEALTIHRALGNRHGEGDILQKMGRNAVMVGDTAAGLAYGRASLEISRELGRADWIGFALLTVAGALMYEGAYDEARRHQEEAQQIFESIHYQLGLSVALGGQAWRLWGEHGATPEAEQLAQRGLAIARRLGNRLQIAQRLVQLAQFANDRGDYAAALRYARESLELTQGIGNPVSHSQVLCYLGEALYHTGDFAAARRSLAQATRLAVDGAFVSRLTQIALCCGTMLLAQSSVPQATDPADLALAAQCLVWAARHPATWHPLRARAAAYLARLRTRAAAAVVAAEALPDELLEAHIIAAITAWDG